MIEVGNIYFLLLIAFISFVLSFIGAAVGLVGGHMRLPLLIAYMGRPQAGAAMNSLISGLGALAGTVRHIRDGRVSWLGLAVMGIPSMVGAVIAIKLIMHVQHFWSYMVIGFMLVISGISMVRKKTTDAPAGEISLARRLTVEMVIGFGLGALAAITGLMLGSLRLPMMIKYLRMDAKMAIGTNMAVGCVTGLTAAAATFVKGAGYFDWNILAVVAPPTILGGYLGGWLTGRVSKETVQKAAGWLIAATGVYLVGQGTAMTLRKKPIDVTAVIVEYPEYEDEWWWDDDESSWDNNEGTPEDEL